MKEQSFLRTGIIYFWQNIISFSEGEKKRGVGKALEILQDLLDMDYVLQNTFFDELSVNQSKPDQLSSLCWF